MEQARERLRAINASSIKKVGEAKARKARRRQRALTKIKKKASQIASKSDLSEREKSKEVPATTIAVAFLTRDTLPLFDKVWSSFFEGCNGRAAVPVVHMQADADSEEGAAMRHDMAKLIEPYGGAIVPHEKTIYGEMRFSFNMVAGMFALARTAAKHHAPNGRLPDWIHFASERCAPVRPCPALQRFLDDTPGVNHLESSPSTSVGVQRIVQVGT